MIARANGASLAELAGAWLDWKNTGQAVTEHSTCSPL